MIQKKNKTGKVRYWEITEDFEHYKTFKKKSKNVFSCKLLPPYHLFFLSIGVI